MVCVSVYLVSKFNINISPNSAPLCQLLYLSAKQNTFLNLNLSASLFRQLCLPVPAVLSPCFVSFVSIFRQLCLPILSALSHCSVSFVSLFRQLCLTVPSALSHCSVSFVSLFRQLCLPSEFIRSYFFIFREDCPVFTNIASINLFTRKLRPLGFLPVLTIFSLPLTRLTVRPFTAWIDKLFINHVRPVRKRREKVCVTFSMQCPPPFPQTSAQKIRKLVRCSR